jgi:hypothetical protein
LFCFTLFIFTCIILYQKPKKIRILGSCFYLSAFSFAEMADGWCVVDDYYGQAIGKLQVESMMSTAASLFPQ